MSETMSTFHNIYQNKRVLVTGHSGFKGSWMALWLTQLGADVFGFSKYRPSEPCNFDVLGLGDLMEDIEGDVRNFDQVQDMFNRVQPDIVFHLAAQPIVRDSYEDPKLTFDTNLGGTVNVLECIRASTTAQAAVMITSDKCYENVGWDQGYKEEDRLGGADPYSASKACAEIAFSAYYRSFFKDKNLASISATRAGNVIGGGDWARDRIVPDCVRALSKERDIILRKPEATRPWQHVLEPLSGYLWLGASLLRGSKGVAGESFNFGPKENVIQSVQELVELFINKWGKGIWQHEPHEGDKKEANLLQLSCEKAKQRLGWEPVLTFEETVAMTAEWYEHYYKQNLNMRDYTISQINEYVQLAKRDKGAWV